MFGLDFKVKRIFYVGLYIKKGLKIINLDLRFLNFRGGYRRYLEVFGGFYKIRIF